MGRSHSRQWSFEFYVLSNDVAKRVDGIDLKTKIGHGFDSDRGVLRVLHPS